MTMMLYSHDHAQAIFKLIHTDWISIEPCNRKWIFHNEWRKFHNELNPRNAIHWLACLSAFPAPPVWSTQSCFGDYFCGDASTVLPFPWKLHYLPTLSAPVAADVMGSLWKQDVLTIGLVKKSVTVGEVERTHLGIVHSLHQCHQVKIDP